MDVSLQQTDSGLASPSMSLDIINHRLDLVERFLRNRSFKEDITNLLRRTFDSQRLVQKFSLGRGDADDLVSLQSTVAATEHIANVLREEVAEKNGSNSLDRDTKDCLSLVLNRLSLKGPNELALRISEAIDEDGLTASHREERIQSSGAITMAQGILKQDGSEEDFQAMSQVFRAKTVAKASSPAGGEEEELWIMRRTASSILQRLHENLDMLRTEKSSLTTRLRSEMNAQSLTLRWTPGLGHICHVKGIKDVRASLTDHGSARNGSTTKSTRAFYLSEWSTLGARMDQVKMQMRAEEQRVFFELRELVVTNLVKLRRNAAVLDELDVACSSAILATEQSLVRPMLNNGTIHKIVAGRHPTVKLGLEEQGRAFISNDCFVGDKQKVWLITGPNMAGKSTFLRQNALISILAQVGSFVPAEHAEMGIVDQMFSRIGSADNLFEDQSTFMVEMLETASILKHATPRSFVIMDEVGRGTTPEDGIAVAFASLHHLYHTNHCRTLFATHFHALADMTNDWNGVGCFCTDVSESLSGSFSFVHRLRHGVNRRSHALKVAKLAGICLVSCFLFCVVLIKARHSRFCDRHCCSGAQFFSRTNRYRAQESSPTCCESVRLLRSNLQMCTAGPNLIRLGENVTHIDVDDKVLCIFMGPIKPKRLSVLQFKHSISRLGRIEQPDDMCSIPVTNRSNFLLPDQGRRLLLYLRLV